MWHAVAGRRNVSERRMRAFVVVAPPPVFGHGSNVGQGVEDVAVEHLRAVGSVKAFDIGVLRGLPRLDELKRDAVSERPVLQRETHELRAVVEPKALRLAPKLDQLIERPDDTSGRETGIDLDAKCLAVVVIDHVEGAKAPARPQRIGHEVGRPGVVAHERHAERLADTRRQPFLAPPRAIELEVPIDAPQARFATRKLARLKGLIEQPKAVTGIVADVGGNGRDRRLVVPGSRPVIRGRAREPKHAAGGAGT